MTSRLVRTPQAQADIQEIAEYLRLEAGLEVALRFVDNTETALQTLAHNPFVGAILDSPIICNIGIRRWHIHRFPNHLILYRATTLEVEIVRVLHGARDLDALFTESNGGTPRQLAGTKEISVKFPE